MVYFWYGENSFELERALSRERDGFSGAIEAPEVERLEVQDLASLLESRSLFDDARLVILKQVAGNKALWDALPELLARVDDAVRLVIVEAKPDKRGKTYKSLIKQTEAREFAAWTQRDETKAVAWLQDEASVRGVSLEPAQARRIVARIGVNQRALSQVIDKLLLADKIDDKVIDDIAEARPEENVFMLLETALRGDEGGVRTMIESLTQANDPYMTFGLLSSQLLQLLALSLSSSPPAETAKEIGAAPFALNKLAPSARLLGSKQVQEFVQWAAETDMQMKSTAYGPWLLIESLLLKIAHKV